MLDLLPFIFGNLIMALLTDAKDPDSPAAKYLAEVEAEANARAASLREYASKRG